MNIDNRVVCYETGCLTPRGYWNIGFNYNLYRHIGLTGKYIKPKQTVW